MTPFPSAALAALLSAPALAAFGDEPFEFLEEEQRAMVVTASREPSSLADAPGSVHVITRRDIADSGALHVWDLLRRVPGVDVVAFRTAHGEVGVRGLNRPQNFRALVLLDGKTVLNGFFDYVNWEAIPVSIEEIERIEVVYGPQSALHGTNAVSGVINIITRRPEDLRGGVFQYTAGERDAHVGTFLYGQKSGKVAYKTGVQWRTLNRFTNADRLASEAAKLHALVSYDLGEDSRLSLSGGAVDHNVHITDGGGYDDGITSFLRADYSLRSSRVRLFWNRGRTMLTPHPLEPRLDYDTFDASAERSFALPYRNALTVGAGYRRNAASSNIFPRGDPTQDLLSLYSEDRWSPAARWTLWTSGRLDRHPFTGWVFSPRASVVYQRSAAHRLHVTFAEAFRNPTLTENYAEFTLTSPQAVVAGLGRTDVDPEKMVSWEAGHRGEFGRWRTSATLFYYRLTDIIRGRTEVVSPGPPAVARTFAVNAGETKAVGGEASLEADLASGLSVFVHYSYQRLTDQLVAQAMAAAGPKNKVSGGLRAEAGGFTGALWAHWVGATYWNTASGALAPVQLSRVPDHTLLNARLAYSFGGRWRGLEAAVNAFNLAGKDHRQGLPGAVIRSRWSGTLAYRFY